MNLRTLLLAAVCVSISAVAQADDWPQWRGQQRDGISQEKGLLAEWPSEGPKLVWKVDTVGFGFSTPSVVGDHLYLLSSEGTSDEFVQARRVKDGSQVWSRRIGKVGSPKQQPSYPGARSTPTADGDALYAFGSDGDLVCLERATGDVRWQVNVREEFAGEPGTWAYSESPLVDGDLVICSPGGSKATLLALKKATGEVAWTSSLPDSDKAAYTSPIATEVDGVKQYVHFLAKGVVGVEASTGKLLWQYKDTANGAIAIIPTPIVHDGHVYTAGSRSGGGLVKLAVDQGTFDAEQLYFNAKLSPGIGGMVLVGDHLYGANSSTVLCVDFKTGKIVWQERSIGASSTCYADGRLYLHGENGDVALIEPTPEGLRQRGHFKPAGQPDRGKSKAWAHPIIAGGRLYIRDLGTLWCYDVKAK